MEEELLPVLSVVPLEDGGERETSVEEEVSAHNPGSQSRASKLPRHVLLMQDGTLQILIQSPPLSFRQEEHCSSPHPEVSEVLQIGALDGLLHWLVVHGIVATPYVQLPSTHLLYGHD